VVAFSILHLSTQTLTAYIMCAYGGKSHLNNVVMLQVKITGRNDLGIHCFWNDRKFPSFQKVYDCRRIFHNTWCRNDIGIYW
jgi:hypothetical protein